MPSQRGSEIIQKATRTGSAAVIGVFDSGLGGLSVLTEIRRVMPSVDLIYLADRARAPYGPRSLDEVREIAHEVAGWLLKRPVETIVIACNTASAAALDSLRMDFEHVSFVGMEPAVKPAAISTNSGVIGVLATEATFQGRLFRSVVSRHAGQSRVVERACPTWVDLVESGQVDGPAVEAAVRDGIQPLLEQGADPLVIGCTHFSFLKPIISRVAGETIRLIDPAPAVAAQTARVSKHQDESGRLTLVTSGSTEEFAQLAWSVAGVKTSQPVLPFPS